MIHVSATEAKNKLGYILDKSQIDAVVIDKNGRPFSVLVSAEEYERLCAIEDRIWALRAEEAMKSGLLSPEESARRLKARLDA
jgi:prevent-host-death family protein